MCIHTHILCVEHNTQKKTNVRNGKEVKLNETVGCLLRTKETTATEGGVAAGYSCLDSFVLV